MDITKLSIKRPIAVIMVMFIVLLLGFVSLSKMKQALMPEMDFPYALILTTYKDAGPEEVENLVSSPIESAISGVENIKNVYSTSQNGTSIVEAEFNYGTDLNQAINDMRESISKIKKYLPSDASEPTIMKFSLNSLPIASISLSSDTMDIAQLNTFAKDTVKNRLERQKGVASANIYGGVENEIVIEVDQEKAEGLGVDMDTVSQVLMSENTNQAGGSIDYGNKTITISSKLKLQNIDDIKKTPIMLKSGQVINLQDIANISEKQKEVSSIVRHNGEQAVVINISKSSDGNVVSAVNAIKKEIALINKENPHAKLELISESASIIENSVSNVISNIFTAAFLSIMVLFVFLKNVGLTGVIGISMPLSIIGTFVLLYFSNTTLNTVALGGISIGVGMLVDNSIVVLENIYRYRTTLGYEKIRGTYLGTKEVLSAIVGSTLTTIVVFVPFLFSEGIVLQMMKDLALAIVFSLVMSLFVAMTVVPMLAANYVDNLHRNKSKKLNFINKILNSFDNFIKKLTNAYGKLLGFAIGKKKRILLFALLISIASSFLLPMIGMEFMPEGDEGVINVTLKTPRGSNLDLTNAESTKFEEYLSKIPELKSLTAVLYGSEVDMSSLMSGGGNETSSISLQLTPKKERKRSVAQIVEEIRKEAKNVAGVEISVSAQNSSMGSGTGSADISLLITGNEMEVLRNVSDEFVRQLENIKGTREIKSSISTTSDEVYVKLNKEKIRSYGLSGLQVASQIRNNVSGIKSTTLKKAGKETDIRIVYPQSGSTNMQQLQNIRIRTNSGIYVPLLSIADIGITDTPQSIGRKNQSRYSLVTMDVYGRDVGAVTSDITKLINQIKLPSGYYISFSGMSEVMMESFSSLILSIILAIILVYMVMASQFESLINPFIIMFSIPLAFTGSWVLLFLFKTPLSVMGLIGTLVLVGIVVNNGIVLIEYIDILRHRDGYASTDAVLKAAPTRLRPILMTALTTILGQIPLIISNGDNAEMLRGMGLVIAGGLTTSTLLTLIVIPLLYLIFDNISTKFRGKFKIKQKNNPLEVEKQCTTWTEEEIAMSKE